MSLPPIAAPADFVPASAITFAGAAGPVCVDRDNPLPMSEPSFRGAVAIAVGVEQVPQRAVAINCTAAGTVTLRLADNSELALPVASGLSILPFQVKAVLAAGTTAVASYANLV